MKVRLIALGVAVALWPAAAEEPLKEPGVSGLRTGTVSLSLEEFRALLEAGEPRPQPEPPPLAWAILAGTVGIDFGQREAVVRLQVATFAQGWVKVPLLGAGATVLGVESEAGSVTTEQQRLVLVADGKAVQWVTLRLALPAGVVEDGQGWSVDLPAASAWQVTWQGLPESHRLVFDSSGVARSEERAILPSSGGVLKLRLVEDRPAEATRWTLAAESLVVRDGLALEIETRLALTGEGGTGNEVTLGLPLDASRLEASGEDLLPLAAGNLGTGKRLTLRWLTPGLLERTVTLRYRIPIGENRWEIRTPQLSEGETRSLVAIRKPVGTRLIFPEGVVEASGEEMPSWMRGSGTFGVVRERADFTVAAEPLPRVAVEALRIPNAEFGTELVADGALVCTASLQLLHRTGSVWRFRLPDGAELLSFRVEGKEALPLESGEGWMEVPIPDGRGEQPASIAFSYTGRTQAFDPVEGGLSLRLPEASGFIENLRWEIRLPAGYDVTALEGNLEIAPKQPASGAIGLLKRFSKSDQPSLEIFYRKQIQP